MAFNFAMQARGDGLNLDGIGERAQAVAEPQKKGVPGFALAQSLTIGGLQREVEAALHGFAWVAGRWIDVPTPYGLQQMRLQRGARTYRIGGEGFPAAPSGHPADCLVSVVPLFPPEWTTRQQALLDKLVASNTGDRASDAGALAQA